MSFKSIEVFAGAGGLALGLEKAGFEHLGLVEFDKWAANTLLTNRPSWNVLCEDIKEVAKRDLQQEFGIKSKELDLLSGGSPCQSFSYAGKKMFLFENVKGLLTHDKGQTFKVICDIFEEQGYKIQYKVLNAWDYGVAQKRERLIVIGIRQDLDYLFFEFPKPYEYKPVLGDILQDVPKSEGAKYSENKADIFKLVPAGGYWRDIPEDIAKEYMKTCWFMEGGRTGILRRLSFDEPSLTVLTTPQMKQTDRCHPTEVRPFTVRENARIQSFPDDWEFTGSMGAKYKQIGNAVPVNLAQEIGNQIINTLKKQNNNQISKGEKNEQFSFEFY